MSDDAWKIRMVRCEECGKMVPYLIEGLCEHCYASLQDEEQAKQELKLNALMPLLDLDEPKPQEGGR